MKIAAAKANAYPRDCHSLKLAKAGSLLSLNITPYKAEKEIKN